MTRSLNHLAQTVYIAMSKQEGGGTLLCLFSESDAPLLLRDSFTGDAVTEEAAGLTVEDSDSQAGQACLNQCVYVLREIGFAEPPPPRDTALRFWGESPGFTDTLTNAPLLLLLSGREIFS